VVAGLVAVVAGLLVVVVALLVVEALLLVCVSELPQAAIRKRQETQSIRGKILFNN
jgi:hypothetical protein